ncbi:acyltransferase [Skermania sp. ID1734]|uniref:acyltransferase family protein n=1 Tax=Skermania sp. ID1734 TaxID=2597516 RepID=UPI00117E0175|nr:acyltransferase [Skermania sp. ID1734]TSD93198.1 acyltransferase [Skermania sp. ID1734]
MATSTTGRMFGLDLLRALAVLSVVVGHALVFSRVNSGWLLGYVAPLGTIGVEIFFVLSGFLIGHILLRSADANQLSNATGLFKFWIRRWTRTLPLYFVFLFIYLLADTADANRYSYAWRYATLTQNLAWPNPRFFAHSWSLSVEEWFYIFVPIAIAGTTALTSMKRGRRFLLIAFVFMAIPMVFRLVLLHNVTDVSTYDAYIRKCVFCRIDSLFIGVAAAYIRLYHKNIFDRLGRRWQVTLPAFVLVAGVTLLPAVVNATITNPLVAAAYFPLLSISIALVLAAATRLQTFRASALDKFIVGTAKISYSLYLGHVLVLMLIFSNETILERLTSASRKATALGVAFGLCYALAAATYIAVERPFMRWRNAHIRENDVQKGPVAVMVG